MEKPKLLAKSSTYRPNLKVSGGENRTLADVAEAPQQVVVMVLVDAPRHAALSPALSYASERPLAPGTLVRVPFGRREVAGLVWSAAPVEASPTTELKAVAQVCGDVPPRAADWCALVDFAAAYYQRNVGEIALSVLPPDLRRLGRDALADRVRRLRKAWANGAGPAPPDEARPALTDAQTVATAAIGAAIGATDPGTSGPRSTKCRPLSGIS